MTYAPVVGYSTGALVCVPKRFATPDIRPWHYSVFQIQVERSDYAIGPGNSTLRLGRAVHGIARAPAAKRASKHKCWTPLVEPTKI